MFSVPEGRPTNQHRLPTVVSFREFVERGACLSYGADLADLHGRAAVYVERPRMAYVRLLEPRASLPDVPGVQHGPDPRPPGGLLRQVPGGPESAAEGRGSARAGRGDPGAARGGTGEAAGERAMNRRVAPVER